MEPVRLYKGTVFGTVIPIKEVNPRDGEEVCGTGVACGGLEPGTQHPDARSAEGVMYKMEAELIATASCHPG